MEKTIEIPEGYEARIEGNKVIIELKESEDERIRKEIIEFIGWTESRGSVRNDWHQKKCPEKWIAYLERLKNERELSFIEGEMEGIRQTCQEIKDAMSLFEPKELTPFEVTFRDYIDSAIRYCLSGEGYQQYIKEWAADLLNLEKQKEQKPESCDCSRDEESYINGIHHVLMNPEAYGLIKQKPAEWSEKDKIHLNNAILVAKKEWGVNSYTARWLESLRDNYKKCNSRWKPSEEQMLALGGVLDYLEESDNEDADIIRELINNLKKL